MKNFISVSFNIPIWLDIIIAWPVMVYRRIKYKYTFRRIYLGEGEWAKVDQEDYSRLGKYKWSVVGTGRNLYAVRHVKVGPRKTKIVRLHREIMNAPKGMLVDHRNGETLDSRRDNLRLATHSQNQCNKRKTESKTSSRYRGVYFDKRRVQWQAYIRYNGKRMYLGCFKSEDDAGKAYDEAAKRYHGEFARLNFPEEYQRAPREIRRISGTKSRQAGTPPSFVLGISSRFQREYQKVIHLRRTRIAVSRRAGMKFASHFLAALRNSRAKKI